MLSTHTQRQRESGLGKAVYYLKLVFTTYGTVNIKRSTVTSYTVQLYTDYDYR